MSNSKTIMTFLTWKRRWTECIFVEKDKLGHRETHVRQSGQQQPDHGDGTAGKAEKMKD
jgi:hypothetical protein